MDFQNLCCGAAGNKHLEHRHGSFRRYAERRQSERGGYHIRYKHTVLKDFPLFCPKCKLTHIIDVEKLEIVIKNTEKQTFII